MCHRPERLLQRHTECLDNTGRSCLCCPQRQVLPEHCTQGELVAVDATGHSQPRPRAGKTADHLVAAEHLGNGQRVGVEVEQAPTACNCRGQVAKIIEAKYATDGTRFRGQLDDPGAVGEGERSPIGIAADVFETGHGAHLLRRHDEPELLAMCADMGVGAVPYSPQGKGRLARPWGEQSHRSSVVKVVQAFDSPLDEPVVNAVQRIAGWTRSRLA